MLVRLARELQSDSIVDGEGLRTVIWFQGCSHNCKGCHNQVALSFTGGKQYEVEEIKKEISTLKSQDGVTFSGGDPFFQTKAFLELAKHCQKEGLNVWAYTGFEFDKLKEMSLKNKDLEELLKNIDVLIDGKFILELRSLNNWYRGSSNQRIIKVPETLEKGEVVLYEKFMEPKKHTIIKYKKNKEIYI